MVNTSHLAQPILNNQHNQNNLINCLPADGRQAFGFDIPPGYTHEKEKTIQIRLLVVLLVVVVVVTNFQKIF